MENKTEKIWHDLLSPESLATLRFALRLFLILLAYYLMKPVRESLILDHGSAELRSYALAGQAAMLLILVPLYSHLIKYVQGDRLFHIVTLFLAGNILIFYFMGNAFGIEIGVAFFVWLGIFSVVQISQFWAMVSDYHCVEMGKKLTSYIAVGGSLGAMIGSMVAKALFLSFGTYGLMLVAFSMLIIALIVPGTDASLRRDRAEDADKKIIGHLLGGLKRVFDVPYLRWIACSVILLNLINSTGEFILADFVSNEFADSANRGSEIGDFYSSFYLYVNMATLFLQALVVRPMYRVIGVGGALISLAVINLCMYLSVFLFPVLGWFAVVKMADNSIDYSVANTTKQILFLPLDKFTRYEGMLAINTFFTRFGDLIQGGLVFLAVSVLSLSTMYLVGVNIALCLVWLVVTIKVSRKFRYRSRLEQKAQASSASG
jgi:AAA family ATP:ADP antiporter